MSSSPPWKEAASLIVVAKASISQKVGQSLTKSMVVASRIVQDEKHKAVASQSSAIAKTDYRIMMVKRSGLSSFMASAFVFPGGAVETADFSPRWWTIFDTCGVSRNELNQFSTRVKGPRPEIISDSLTFKNAAAAQPDLAGDLLPPDVGLRIAALRETFEETGVLLLTDPREQDTGEATSDNEFAGDLAAWREKVRKDGSAFIDLCLESSLCPDIWSLHEWSNWLTPISVGHKRFDTMFYITCLEKQPKVVLDQTEVTTLKWCTSLEMLEEHTSERVFLPPPQVYELSRIHHLPNFAGVKSFASQRNDLGNQRWLPVLATYKDGAISFLPGDSLYPDKPDFIGRKPVPDFAQTLAETRANSGSLNRIELRGPICMTYCNFKLPCGHLSPITFPPSPSAPVTQSLL